MRFLSHWLQEYSQAESLDFLREIALAHSRLGGSEGRKLRSLIKQDKLNELCLYQIDLSREGWDPDELYHCRQVVALFSKLESFEIKGINKEEAALKAFWDAEALCKSTNEIFRLARQGRFHFPRDVAGQLHTAQRLIARVLSGDPPSREMLGYRFGKGATTLTKKRLASVRRKLADGVSCSDELLPAASAYLGELPALCEVWASSITRECYDTEEESRYSIPVQIMDGRLEFVPKNAKTLRGTVTEPVLNGLVQLAFGDYLFPVLKRSGIDLRDQTRNQNLAREGSLTGALATLDLTSASDCIASELVFDLLPLEWAYRLAQCRTGHITVKGQRVTLEKFSSMGNGFTFPLESLIFWALARAVCSSDEVVSVYGDDIILPSHRFTAMVKLLTAVGFIPNVNKSYHTGPFRESCGADFYSGIDVRPYFQKKWVSPATLFTMHNYYKRRGLEDFAERVQGYIHPELKVFGPDGYGDGHLIGDFEPKVKARFARLGYSGFLFETYAVVPKRDTSPEAANDSALPSYLAYRSEGAEIVPRIDVAPESLLRMPTRLSTAIARPSWPRESLPVPESVMDNGTKFKAVDLPLTEIGAAFKRKSIYTW